MLTLQDLKRDAHLFYSRDFWSSSSLIENYSNAILRDSAIQASVNIKFTKTTAFVHKGQNKGTYVINIPYVKFDDREEEKINRDIILRSSFLRHEISHILYTEFECLNSTKSKFLLNCLEDARIEYLFSRKYKGANDVLAVSHLFFHERNKDAIENGKLSIGSLGLYILSRSKGDTFNENEKTKIYEDLFLKHKDFYLSKETKDLIPIVEKIVEEFNEIKSKNKDLNKTKSDKKDLSLGKMPKPPEVEDDFDNDDFVEQKASENDVDSIEEEIENSPEDSDTDENAEDESKEKEFSDFISESIKEEQEDILEEENKDAQDLLEKIINREEKRKEEITNLKENATGENFLDKIIEDLNDNCSTLEELEKRKKDDFFSEELFGIAPILPYDTIVSIFDDVIPERNSAFFEYAKVVSKNSKVITDAVNYLKIKFQTISKTKNISNRDEGLLDTYHLSKIFSNDNNVFYKKLNSFVDKSHVCLLMDYSGSMMSEIKSAFISLVVFNEILDRLNIPRSIYFFTSDPSRDIYYFDKKQESKIKKLDKEITKLGGKILEHQYETSISYDVPMIERLSKLPQNERSAKFLTEFVPDFTVKRSETGAFIYRIRSMEEKNNRLTKEILGSFFKRCPFSARSTPEPDCTYTLHKIHQHLKNKKFFLINDGYYGHTISEDSNISDKLHRDIKQEEIKEQVIYNIEDDLEMLSDILLNKKEIQRNMTSKFRFFAIQKMLKIMLEATKSIKNGCDYLVRNAEQRMLSQSVKRLTQKNRQTIRNSLNRDADVQKIKEISKAFENYEQKIQSFLEKKSYDSFNLSIGIAQFSVKISDDGLMTKFSFNIANDYFVDNFFKNVENRNNTTVAVLNNYLIKPISDEDLQKIIENYSKNSITTRERKIELLTHNLEKISQAEKTIDKYCADPSSKYDREATDAKNVFNSKGARNHFNEYYVKLIDLMRNSGWQVYGLGIRSDAGKQYIGESSFQVIESAEDIKINFSKKLRSII